MTRSPSAVLIGEQQPRVSSVPKALSSDGQAAVELAAAAGLDLDPWQQLVLDGALGYRRDGRWSAFEVGLLVPRQNGKGSILEARELAGLFLFGEQLILHSAHEFKTAQEAFLRVLQLVQDNPDFDRKVKTVHTAHGKEGITLKSGQRLRFVARSKGSGRGFTGDCVVLDEAYALTSKMVAALLHTMSARPNPQLWYTSSAGDEEAYALAKVRARGHAGMSSRLAFYEWSAPEPSGDEPVDLDDRRIWAMANPALGIRIEEEFVAGEREAEDDEDFARERLGIWPRRSGPQLIDLGSWRGVCDEDAAPSGELQVALDVSPDRQRAAVVVSGNGVCELVQVGSRAAVARWLRDESREAREHVIRIDGGGPAGAMADDLESDGLEFERMPSDEVAAACARIFDAIEDGTVRFRSVEGDEFDLAVDGVAKKTFGDRFAWSRSASANDVTPLVAATLAYVPADEAPEPFALWGD